MVFNKENLLKTLKDLPGNVEVYISNIPSVFYDRKRNEDSWTIREHLYHIVSVQELLYERISKIRDQENPVIAPFFPENEPERASLYESIGDAFIRYKEVREKQAELINSLTEADFGKEAEHSEYIRYNIPMIINHMIFHEYWHMYRIEELWLEKDEYFK